MRVLRFALCAIFGLAADRVEGEWGQAQIEGLFADAMQNVRDTFTNQLADAKDAVLKRFAGLDLDGNGMLSREELQEALGDNAIIAALFAAEDGGDKVAAPGVAENVKETLKFHSRKGGAGLSQLEMPNKNMDFQGETCGSWGRRFQVTKVKSPSFEALVEPAKQFGKGEENPGGNKGARKSRRVY